MYFLKKIKIIICIVICITNLAYAKNIDVESKHTYIEDSTYYLDTSFNLSLTEEADKALRHGIPLEIHIYYQLRLKREWLWDKTISEKKIIYKLEHRPLTKNFLTINLNTGIRSSHSNLDAALNQISSVSKMKLFDKNLLRQDEVYTSRIKTYLDISALPSPMRPQAYFSSNWKIASDWVEWEVDK